MIFFTFHHDQAEIKVRMESIEGFISYEDGGNCLLLASGEKLFIDENWDYIAAKFKQLEEATRQAAMSANVIRRFNGEGN